MHLNPRMHRQGMLRVGLAEGGASAIASAAFTGGADGDRPAAAVNA